MPINVEVPALGESISEVVLLKWHKEEGDKVAVDEPLCELESDKATVDLPAPAAGVLHQLKQAGETVKVGEVVAEVGEAAVPAEPQKSEAPQAAKSPQPKEPTDGQPAAKKKPPKAERPLAPSAREAKPAPTAKPVPQVQPPVEPHEAPKAEAAASSEPPTAEDTLAVSEMKVPPQSPPADGEGIRRVPMSRIRRSIAERLVRARQTTAMLTTFNEIDVTAVQELRARNGKRFQEVHGVSLGLMSFFARATVLALKQFPILNAQLESNDILYHEHVGLGLAVSTDRGLVVPVLKNAETMSLARIEIEIKRAAAAAKDGKLSLADLGGGTFTITNGGVFGSLLSTPILNPPETGILGMHAIQERPVVVQGSIQARPMMYVALTYDHRLVDGKDSVSFLKRIKELIENPLDMILDI